MGRGEPNQVRAEKDAVEAERTARIAKPAIAGKRCVPSTKREMWQFPLCFNLATRFRSRRSRIREDLLVPLAAHSSASSTVLNTSIASSTSSHCAKNIQ